MFRNITQISRFNNYPIEEEECSICTDAFSITDNIVAHEVAGATEQGITYHTFHLNCLNFWKDNNPTCPICRERITEINGVPVQNEQQYRPLNLIDDFDGNPQIAPQPASRLETSFLRGNYSEELNMASATGDLGRVNQLITIETSDEEISNALVIAARYSHPTMVERAGIQHVENANHVAVVETLLGAGAEIPEEMRLGAITFAAHNDQPAIVTAIEQHGPVSQEIKDRFKNYAILMSLAMQPPQISEAILQNILEWTLRPGEEVQPFDHYRGESIVRIAREGEPGARDAIHAFLENGAISNEHRQAAIAIVRARAQREEQDDEIIALLQEPDQHLQDNY